jgi:multisubunit Na+/H+ antiporter MnhE subunit
VHATRRFVTWWVLLSLLWMALVSSNSPAEIVTGIGCAAVAAGAALLANSAMDQQYTVDIRWLRWFLLAVPAAVSDTIRLARLLPRPHAQREAGRLRELWLPAEGPRRSAGRRAVVVVALGLAPSSYVVAVENRRLLLHEMAEPGSDRLSREVCR